MDSQAGAAIADHHSHLGLATTSLADTKPVKPITVFESILASKGLSDEEKQEDRIAQEGFVVLVAGGETTARVLTTATYHLLANQTALHKLREEIATVMVTPETQVDVKTLEQLPWLVITLLSC